ncbi:Oligopeptide transport ATP-binding protein OppD [Methanosarcina siciliae C2J]|uniref:Nickel import system ATP-binding protein NikD n=1 Tax=Methanosarcina siciliae C2J TaxID=1434118 RepID=A0A0E3PL35_9EURY|nr:ABC transporter ATP-binding protein [Methanosarcina siciliae]AKB35799.1 Oligopeptide transport ATP-binding protein OppD [Methanosarcina siciliae C2J]
MNRSENILEIHDLDVFFETNKGYVKAVNKVSLNIGKGECIGIIGETGSGKSVVGQSVLRLLANNAHVNGSIYFQGMDLLEIDMKEMKKLRGKKISLIPQNPAKSLNPVLKNGKQIIEVFDNKKITFLEKREKVISIMKQLLLKDPEKVYNSYPHQLSGGMKQRLLAAIALCSYPELLIADEPTKGLDPDSMEKVCELFTHIKEDHKRTMLIITHDLDFALGICDRIAVMYSGEVVEVNGVKKIINSPAHPYTQGLINALPRNGLVPLRGQSPSRIFLPKGCFFSQRCRFNSASCVSEHPNLREFGGGMVRCHMY